MSAKPSATRPLEGKLVIELGRVVLAPYAGQILVELGAEVIKIEAPEGDIMRHLQPAKHPGMSSVYLTCNRGKKSVVLDLKQAADVEKLKWMLAKADVFIHNLRPKSAARLGISYEQLKAVNPALVYCSTTGFGSAGPYAEKAAYDDVIQAASGLVSLGQMVDGKARYVPTIMADKATALMAVIAVASALVKRAETGAGCQVEVPMFETMVSFLSVEHLAGLTFDPPLGGPGYNRILSPHRRPYPTKDGFLTVLPYSEKNWHEFFGLIGEKGLLDDPRFATHESRLRNIDVLYGRIGEIMVGRTTREWLDLFDGADFPFTPVSTLADLVADEHLEAVEFWSFEDHPTEGRLRAPRSPMIFDQGFAGVPGNAPRLGEHTDEVLRRFAPPRAGTEG